jgi:hypothetical protein
MDRRSRQKDSTQAVTAAERAAAVRSAREEAADVLGIEAAVRDFCTKNRCNPSVFSALNNTTTVWQNGHELEALTRAVV